MRTSIVTYDGNFCDYSAVMLAKDTCTIPARSHLTAVSGAVAAGLNR